jgi:hypothetical protein
MGSVVQSVRSVEPSLRPTLSLLFMSLLRLHWVLPNNMIPSGLIPLSTSQSPCFEPSVFSFSEAVQ